MPLIALALAYWKQIAIVAAVVAGFFWYQSQLSTARDEGYQKRRAEEIADTQRRLDKANTADEKAKVCAADPNCRLASDPNERKEE